MCGCLLMGIICVLLLWERSPPLYHAYTAMTVFLWTQLFSEYQFLKALWRDFSGRNTNDIIELSATTAVSVFVLEVLVFI